MHHIQNNRASVPAAFDASISLDAHQKAADYSVTKTRLVMLEALVQAGLLYFWTLGGGLQWLDASWREVLPDQQILRGALVILSAFSSVVWWIYPLIITAPLLWMSASGLTK